MQMALRMADRTGGDTMNARRDSASRWGSVDQDERGEENPLAAREGMLRAGKLLRVLSRKVAPNGERSLKDPFSIECNQ